MQARTTTTDNAAIWPAVAAMLLSIIIAALILAAPARAATVGGEQPTQFQLDNGLTIVVVPDHRVPIVTHMVFYKIGSVDEGPGEEGLAHYLEHMMFQGTDKYPRGSFDRFVMTGGGAHNATTKQDGTTYFQRMPREALERLMDMEADRMERLNFDPAAALNERSVVMEEFRGKAGQAGFPLFHAMGRAMFGDHPYALAPIGSEAGIAAFDGAKAMAFYRRHYAPNRAIVVIGGDVTEAEVRKLAGHSYARVTAKPNTDTVDRTVPKLEVKAERVIVPFPRVNSVTVSRTYLLDKTSALPMADATALSLFTYIAADGVLSRMHGDLVATGLANAVSGNFNIGRYAGQLTFEAAALSGVSAETIEAAFDRSLGELAEGVTEREFADMKQRFLATRVWDEDNTAQRSQSIGESMVAGWKLADVLNARQRIEAVTIEDVNRLARDVLQKRRSVTGLLVPEVAAADPVKVAN